MQFDGEARYRSERQERHLGALRREGFQPARRHPSASRRRSKERLYGFADPVLHDSVYPESSNRRVGFQGNNEGCLCSGGGNSVSAGNGGVERERSWSAPPVRRDSSGGASLSADLKAQRASSAALKLSKMEKGDPFARPEVKGLYTWLKSISLQEYLPVLLQIGVAEVAHIPDVDLEDLEDAGMARPERKRFLRAQASLVFAGVDKAPTALCIRSESARKGRQVQISDMDSSSSVVDQSSSAMLSDRPLSSESSRSRGMDSESSERSTCLTALLQASTGTPASGQTEGGGSSQNLESLPVLMDCKEFLTRTCSICKIVTRRSDVVNSCGFLAALEDLGVEVIVTTCNAIPSESVAASSRVLFENDVEYQLDPDTLWWCDADLGICAVACCGPCNAVDPVPLFIGTCGKEDDVWVLHPDECKLLTCHRVSSASIHQIRYSTPGAAHPPPGCPVFVGSLAVGVFVGFEQDGSVCRAVPVHNILSSIAASRTLQRHDAGASPRAPREYRDTWLPPAGSREKPLPGVVDAMRMDRLRRGSSRNGFTATPYLRATSLPLSLGLVNGKELKTESANRSSSNEGQSVLPIIQSEPHQHTRHRQEQEISASAVTSRIEMDQVGGSREEEAARSPIPMGALPEMELERRDAPQAISQNSLHSVALPASHRRRVRSSSPLPSTSLPCMSASLPVTPSTDLFSASEVASGVGVGTTSAHALGQGESEPPHTVDTMGQQCSSQSFAELDSSVRITPVRLHKVEQLQSSEEGGVGGSGGGPVILRQNLGKDQQHREDDEGDCQTPVRESPVQLQEGGEEEIGCRAKCSLVLEEDSREVFEAQRDDGREGIVDDDEHASEALLSQGESQNKSPGSSSPASPPRTPSQEASDTSEAHTANPLQSKLAEAGLQILVHIVAHCPEQHILSLALARIDAIVGVCVCEGQCVCAHRQEFAVLGGVPSLVHVARGHAHSEDIQVRVLGIMASLALCCNVQRVIATSGGVESALAAMAGHPSCAAVQCKSCQLLCNLAFEDTEVQVRILESGGVNAVVGAMLAFLSSAHVQAEGCGALCNLAANACEGTSEALRDGGAHVAVVRAMSMHGMSKDVQLKGCCALCALSGDVLSCVDGDKDERGGPGGVVIKAMLLHAGVPGLQYKACSALCSIARDASGAQSLGRLGGVAAVLKSLEFSGSDVYLVCKALRAIQVMCSARENYAHVMRHNGAQITVDAMRRHAVEEEVQIRACAVLGTLCRDAGCLQDVSEHGGVEAICQCVIALSHSESLLVEACGALAVLALGEHARAVIARTAVLVAVQMATEGLHADSSVLRAAASRLERVLSLPGSLLQNQARDTRDTLLSCMSTKARTDRRPISATLTASRPPSARPSMSHPSAARRPASATFAGKGRPESALHCGKDSLRDSLVLQKQIFTLKKEAETLRHENLQIMAGAVSNMAGSPALDGVRVDCTISELRRTDSGPLRDVLHNNSTKRPLSGLSAKSGAVPCAHVDSFVYERPSFGPQSNDRRAPFVNAEAFVNGEHGRRQHRPLSAQKASKFKARTDSPYAQPVISR